MSFTAGVGSAQFSLRVDCVARTVRSLHKRPLRCAQRLDFSAQKVDRLFLPARPLAPHSVKTHPDMSTTPRRDRSWPRPIEELFVKSARNERWLRRFHLSEGER